MELSAHEPRNVRALIYRGKANENLKLYDKAADDFSEALKRASGSATADMYYDLGKVRLQAGKFKQAIEVFDKVIQMQPDHGLAHANRGVAYKNLGEYKRAAADFQNALSILKDPKRVSQVKRHLEETEARIKASDLGDPQYRSRTKPTNTGRLAGAEPILVRAEAKEPGGLMRLCVEM